MTATVTVLGRAMRGLGWTAIALAMISGTPAAAADDDAAQRFGARQDIWAASLSPDGKHVAFLRPTQGAGAAVFVGDLTTGADPKAVLVSSGSPDRLQGCGWITDARLVCTVYMIADTGDGRLAYTRSVALNSDGSDVKQLSARTDVDAYTTGQNGGDVIDLTGDGKGEVLMTRQFEPENTTGTIISQQQPGMGVELVDTASLKRHLVIPSRPDADEFISDGLGTVRVMGVTPAQSSGYSATHTDYFYRLPNGSDWKPLSSVTFAANGEHGFDPEAVDPTTNAAYGFDDDGGHRALFKVALDGSMKRELVSTNPAVDVGELLTIGRQNRVVGFTEESDRRVSHYSDPTLASLAGSLGKALPNLPLIDFVGASADEQQLLLFAGSDSDPGHYYLFDKETHKLSELFVVRPQLSTARLATVRPITFKAGDGTTIPAYLTLPPGSDGKNLPAIVMPHGGPASRDEWGFDWLSQYFASQGFAVLQPEFRGSAGYGEAWFQKNGFQSWKTAIGDVDDAGRYLLSSGTAAPGKIGIFGWSYGGYAALQSGVLDPGLFKAIVAVAPVTDLQMTKDEARRFMNYNFVATEIGSGPHIVQGSPLQNVRRFQAPVLIFHGDQDMNVPVEESRAIASKLKGAGKPVTYVEFKGLDHQLDDQSARSEMLRKSSDVFRKAFGM